MSLDATTPECQSATEQEILQLKIRLNEKANAYNTIKTDIQKMIDEIAALEASMVQVLTYQDVFFDNHGMYLRRLDMLKKNSRTKMVEFENLRNQIHDDSSMLQSKLKMLSRVSNHMPPELYDSLTVRKPVADPLPLENAGVKVRADASSSSYTTTVYPITTKESSLVVPVAPSSVKSTTSTMSDAENTKKRKYEEVNAPTTGSVLDTQHVSPQRAFLVQRAKMIFASFAAGIPQLNNKYKLKEFKTDVFCFQIDEQWVVEVKHDCINMYAWSNKRNNFIRFASAEEKSKTVEEVEQSSIIPKGVIFLMRKISDFDTAKKSM